MTRFQELYQNKIAPQLTEQFGYKSPMQVPRITNRGTRGGSPWAATVVNALMIDAIEHVHQQQHREE